jgi:threonine synthase
MKRSWTARRSVGAGGFGCEPASGRERRRSQTDSEQQGVIAPSDRVVCILTGHQLKDPNATVNYHTGAGEGDLEAGEFANSPIAVENDFETIMDVIRRIG